MSVSIEHMPEGHTRLVVDGAVVWDDENVDGRELSRAARLIKRLVADEAVRQMRRVLNEKSEEAR